MVLKVAYTGDLVMGKPVLDFINKTPGVELVAIAANPENSGMVLAADGIQVLNIKEINSETSLNLLAKLSVDLVINFNSIEIFSAELLGIPRLGSMNFHPGPLPEYAGLYVYQWAILNGEKEFGVSIHWMVERIDAGDILEEDRFPVSGEDTGLTLYFKTLKHGVVLFKKLVEKAAAGNESFAGHKQDLGKRRYYSRNIPNSGHIDWNWSAEYIGRYIRAMSYRPYISPTFTPYFKAGEVTCEIVKAGIRDVDSGTNPGRIQEINDSGFVVSTGQGSLIVHKVYLDGNILDAAVAAENLKLSRGDILT